MKTKQLQWWDVVVISIILFGSAIWSSTIVFLTATPEIMEQATEFTAADNWLGICSIVIELVLSYLYLCWRKFDFSQWNYKITVKSTVAAIGIFLLFSVIMDIVDIFYFGWADATAHVGEGGIRYILAEIDISLILFSLLNGFYEEIFFLGICTVVPKQQQKGILCYSLLVRFSFHTYQGILSALDIGFIMGGILYFLYKKKSQNLYPYMLAHTFTDIFGAGILLML